jgi:hypothetical protein
MRSATRSGGLAFLTSMVTCGVARLSLPVELLAEDLELVLVCDTSQTRPRDVLQVVCCDKHGLSVPVAGQWLVLLSSATLDSRPVDIGSNAWMPSLKSAQGRPFVEHIRIQAHRNFCHPEASISLGAPQGATSTMPEDAHLS